MPNHNIWIKLAFILVMSLMLQASSALAEEENWYIENWKYDFKRANKNVLSSPLEIPVAIDKHAERKGLPFVRHITGLGEGSVEAVSRVMNAAWDYVFMWIPGSQEGAPLDPETRLNPPNRKPI